MANLRSTYVFRNEEDFENVKNVIYDKFYQVYNNSDKIWFYGGYSEPYIEIYDGINQDELEDIVSIIREHGGRFK